MRALPKKQIRSSWALCGSAKPISNQKFATYCYGLGSLLQFFYLFRPWCFFSKYDSCSQLRPMKMDLRQTLVAPQVFPPPFDCNELVADKKTVFRSCKVHHRYYRTPVLWRPCFGQRWQVVPKQHNDASICRNSKRSDWWCLAWSSCWWRRSRTPVCKQNDWRNIGTEIVVSGDEAESIKSETIEEQEGGSYRLRYISHHGEGGASGLTLTI